MDPKHWKQDYKRDIHSETDSPKSGVASQDSLIPTSTD